MLPWRNLTDLAGAGPHTNADLWRLFDPTVDSALPYVYDHFEWPHCAEEGYPLRLINATRDGAAGDGAAGYVGHPV